MSTDTPTSTLSNCAHCQAPAHMKCSGCSSKLGDEALVFTYYCNRECQVANLKSHKSSCKAHQTRKLLYRAGETLQEIFYQFREVLFDKNIAKIENKDGKLLIYEAPYTTMTSSLDVLYDFPANLVQSTEDKHAVLAYLTADEALAWMKDITEHFLKGIENKIEETTFTPKSPQRTVQQVSPDGTYDNFQYPNSCFKITLRNGGGVYGLDLSGAQYGYYKPITPWTQYLDDRVFKVGSSKPFGSKKTLLIQLNGDLNISAFVGRIYQDCSKSIRYATEKWEATTNIPILSFLKLPREEFARLQKVWWELIADALSSCRKRIQEQADSARENPGSLPKVSLIPGKYENDMKMLKSFQDDMSTI